VVLAIDKGRSVNLENWARAGVPPLALDIAYNRGAISPRTPDNSSQPQKSQFDNVTRQKRTSRHVVEKDPFCMIKRSMGGTT
jgi:hypothetical protein